MAEDDVRFRRQPEEEQWREMWLRVLVSALFLALMAGVIALARWLS